MKLDKKIDYQELILHLTNEQTRTDEEMDAETAHIILERIGVDVSTLGLELKKRLLEEKEEMLSRGEEVPENLLKLLKTL